MREYKNKITLTKNARGIYCLDPSVGCNSGMKNNKRGCYNDCYAAKSAKLYGYDFSKTVLRCFENEKHKHQIVSQISKIKLDFVRMGCSGDPSEDWEHTISILKVISRANKEIVIITKHWTFLTDEHLKYLSTINVCINTSVSALDNPQLLKNCVKQYNRIKPYCKSVLRIVSCDFNKENLIGKRLYDIQDKLFKNESILDTVFRVNKNNPLVKDGIINIKKASFLGKNCLISKYNRKTYFGKCSNCHEMCGVDIKNENYIYQNKPGIIKQLKLF